MALQIVLMPGANRVELPLLRATAQNFGWAIEIAHNMSELLQLRERGRIGAVLFQQDSLGCNGSWLETIAQVKAATPEARLVACNHFSDADDYPKLCRAGLFHALWLPLKESEVLQCLGFIWEAEKHLILVARRPRLHLARAAS